MIPGKKRVGFEITLALCTFFSIGVLLFIGSFFLFHSEVDYQYVVAEGVQNEVPKEPPVVHIQPPVSVKAAYMTQCLASSKTLRAPLVGLIDTTELNSLVIDIKDYSGRISFVSENPLLAGKTSPNCFASDMKDFLKELHAKGIYVIGRITVFQDPYMAKINPAIAIKKASDKTVVWKDRKGVSYIDPGEKEMWNYIVALAKESYALGFDEINFDYIRFPSDGDMTDIYFPVSDLLVTNDPEMGKVTALDEFFSYLHAEMRENLIPHSADVFGMTTTNTDDLNIGQVLERVMPYFDYVAPMVYPSHYPPTFMGFANPAEHPYEVIRYSMDEAFRRSSTTPQKLRPWLQDFNLGATYTPEMVRAQIKATYDAGLNSWMLWNAASRYTRDALEE